MNDEPRWRKSSYSNDGANCVEVAPLPNGAAIRDSKNPDDAVIRVTPEAWADFLAGVRAGDFS